MENQDNKVENIELVTKSKKTLKTQIILIAVLLIFNIGMRFVGYRIESFLFVPFLSILIAGIPFIISLWSLVLAVRGISIGSKLMKINKPNWVLYILSWFVLVYFLYSLTQVITHGPTF